MTKPTTHTKLPRFSDFIRSASSAERKRVCSHALKVASEQQAEQIAKARAAKPA